MKRILFAAVAVAALTTGAAHAANTNNVGCGLGTMAFKGQSGLGPQVMAVTTNGTSGNQTFGITSGTLGCTKNGVVDPPQAAAAFTASNIDNLARDAARGEGESLESLAETMGVEEQDKPAFFAMSKDNFSTIFASENDTAGDVLNAWYGVMAGDEVLKRYATS
jgi:opacity protein-like surface antigen